MILYIYFIQLGFDAKLKSLNIIEILKPTGQRREINMNENGIKYIIEKYNIEIGSTYVNNDWNIGIKE